MSEDEDDWGPSSVIGISSEVEDSTFLRFAFDGSTLVEAFIEDTSLLSGSS